MNRSGKDSLRLARDDWDSPEVRSAWTGLVHGSSHFDLLEQSPEFLDHLRGTSAATKLSLATVRDGDGAIVGVIPLRLTQSDLKFDAFGRLLWESRLRSVRILGSLPLLPADPVPHDLLFAALSREFADCGAIAMPSVPTDSFLWQYLRESPFLKSNFLSYAVNGVRGCHTIALPATVDEYRARFGSKKRYNLNRQARILQGQGGGRLELRRFDAPWQVGDLVGSLDEVRASEEQGRWARSGPPAIDRHQAEDLAGRGLLLDYLLFCGNRPCAALIGQQYRGVYYLSSVHRDRGLDRFSPGATAVHLAIEDLIRETPIGRIDFGFGEPAYSHSCTNVVEPRASVLLLRGTLANQLRRDSHALFQSLVKLARRGAHRPSPGAAAASK